MKTPQRHCHSLPNMMHAPQTMSMPAPAPQTSQQTTAQPATTATATAKRSKKGIILTHPEKLTLLRCCLQCKVAYKRGTKMKYWTSVSQQFERVATRACTPVSCERAVFKLVKLRRRVLHDRASSTTRGGNADADGELEGLVDRVMKVLDGLESGQEQVPCVAEGYEWHSEMAEIPRDRSSPPPSTVKPVTNNAPQRRQLEETRTTLPIPILDRVNYLYEMQPIISNRLESMERSVQELRQTCNSQMESMEDVLAAMGEVLTDIRG